MSTDIIYIYMIYHPVLRIQMNDTCMQNHLPRFCRYGKWFRTRLFGQIHVFVPSVEGAKTVFSNDFVVFNKGYLKSMADAVGKKSLLCVPRDVHRRIRGILADPLSMNSVSKFVPKFDRELSQRLRRREREGRSFRVLEFTMKVCEIRNYSIL